jgi:ubiquinone/menaquinone biosynthesis C-methylase UbiE
LSNLPEYSTITEAPGLKATAEQAARIFQRYRFCREQAAGGDILESACGSGIGLCYLAWGARSVVGADIDGVNISAARKGCAQILLVRMDAHELCFSDACFDLVLLLEAVYYLREPARFIGEAARVLRSGGQLIIGSVNKDWPDFHPSPFIHRYFSVPEMTELLAQDFPKVSVYGGFKIEQSGLKNAIVTKLKHLALNFNLIPGSLKMRAYLKRIFIGQLAPLPAAVTEDMAPYEPPVPIPADKPCPDYKIIYFVAMKSGSPTPPASGGQHL